MYHEHESSDTFMIHFNMIIYGKYQIYGKINIIYPYSIEFQECKTFEISEFE